MDIIYLLMLAAGTFILLFSLNLTQKSVLRELEKVLYKEYNPDQYIAMLESRRLGLIFRKGTLLLLRLNGALLLENDEMLLKLSEEASVTRMSRSERLNLCQKLFNYYLVTQRSEQAKEYYGKLLSLLAEEKDEELKLILEDTKLYGVYIEKNTKLIPDLLELQQKQSGRMQGITAYRLAKLYWYSGETKKMMECLKLSSDLLKGTEWEHQVSNTIEHPEILENK